MTPMPHLIRAIRKYLRDHKLPDAVYVSQPHPAAPMVIGFNPPLPFLKRNGLRILFGSSVPSRDGSRLTVLAPEDRKIEHRMISYEDMVEAFQPSHVVGTLVFTVSPKGNTNAEITFEQHGDRAKERLEAHLQEHFESAKQAVSCLVPRMQDQPNGVEVSRWPGCLRISFPIRFTAPAQFEMIKQTLATQARIHFVTDIQSQEQ